MSHVNAHQRVTLAEENFNNQIHRMTHSVDTSWPLSQSTLSPPNGLMNKVMMVIGMEVMHGLSNMDFHSPRLTWLQPLLSAQYDSSRNQYFLQFGTIPWWQVGYIGPFSSLREKMFLLE